MGGEDLTLIELIDRRVGLDLSPPSQMGRGPDARCISFSLVGERGEEFCDKFFSMCPVMGVSLRGLYRPQC